MTLDDIINAKITNALFSIRITSANPTHINYVIDTRGFGATGENSFAENLEAEIKRMIEEYAAKGEPTPTTETGLGITDILRASRTGLQGPEAVMGMLTRFIPHIAAALLALGFAQQIVDVIVGPGGPLDLRFKRDMGREIENYLSRQQQRDTQIGKRQVIIQAQQGFNNMQGRGNSNIMRQVRESVGGNRISDIGLNERSYGQYWRTS